MNKSILASVAAVAVVAVAGGAWFMNRSEPAPTTAAAVSYTHLTLPTTPYV